MRQSLDDIVKKNTEQKPSLDEIVNRNTRPSLDEIVDVQGTKNQQALESVIDQLPAQRPPGLITERMGFIDMIKDVLSHAPLSARPEIPPIPMPEQTPEFLAGYTQPLTYLDVPRRLVVANARYVQKHNIIPELEHPTSGVKAMKPKPNWDSYKKDMVDAFTGKQGFPTLPLFIEAWSPEAAADWERSNNVGVGIANLIVDMAVTIPSDAFIARGIGAFKTSFAKAAGKKAARTWEEAVASLATDEQNIAAAKVVRDRIDTVNAKVMDFQDKYAIHKQEIAKLDQAKVELVHTADQINGQMPVVETNIQRIESQIKSIDDEIAKLPVGDIENIRESAQMSILPHLEAQRQELLDRVVSLQRGIRSISGKKSVLTKDINIRNAAVDQQTTVLHAEINDIMGSVYDEVKIREDVAKNLPKMPNAPQSIKGELARAAIEKEAPIIPKAEDLVGLPMETRVRALNDAVADLRNYHASLQDRVELSYLRQHVEHAMEKQTAGEIEAAGRRLAPEDVETLTWGVSAMTTKKYNELPLLQLRTLVDNIDMQLGVGSKMPLLDDWFKSVTPAWRVFERAGIPRAYDVIDGAKYTEGVLVGERDVWESSSKEGFKKLFKKDLESEEAKYVLAEYADKGVNNAVLPPEITNKFSGDELRYMKDIVTGDKVRWDAHKQTSIDQGIGTIDPAEADATGKVLLVDYYYHHRTPFYDDVIAEFKKQREQWWEKQSDNLRWEKYRGDINRVMPADLGFDVEAHYRQRGLQEKIPTKINASEFMRRMETDTEYSRDFWNITRQSYQSEIRKLYLEPALLEADAIVKVLPERMKNEMVPYLREYTKLARGMEVKGDVTLNRMITKRSLGIERMTKGRWKAQERAWEHASSMLRQNIIRGTMHYNPRIIGKNLFQTMHSVATIGPRATLAGIESMFTKGGRGLLDHYHTMLGRTPFEGLDITKPRTWDKFGMWMNQAVERYINCASAGNGAIHYLLTRSEKHMMELNKFAISKGYTKQAVTGARMWDTFHEAVHEGHFKDLVEMGNRNIKVDQYSYHRWDMPQHLWSASGKNAFMFTSWPSNAFRVFYPQLWKQMRHGKNVFGGKADMWQRFALLSHVTMTGALYVLGQELGYNMGWILASGQLPTGYLLGTELPFPVSPVISAPIDAFASSIELAKGAGNALIGSLGGDEKRMNYEFTKRFWYRDFPSFVIPGGAFGLAIYQAKTGKQDWSSLLMSRPAKKKETGGVRTGVH